ncbi:hypothetical protein Taro_008744 [Colocasia esculenta]|uniref:Uncharacterized protein n=1 Tax=Colocasia esculenta TaxID=4460 RepID=A0A843TUI9_COLES|nr:hypothetical protein [Colocasia esculenta]
MRARVSWLLVLAVYLPSRPFRERGWRTCRWDPCRDMHTLSDQLASLQEAFDSYPQLDSVVEFPSRDRTPRPGRSFWGLHDTTDWCERAKERIQNWERRGKQVKSSATTDDAYLQAYALKYGGKLKELERVRRAVGADASSSIAAKSSQSDLEDRLGPAVRRAEDVQVELAEQGLVDSVTRERDQLCIRAEAAEARVAEVTGELVTLRVQRSSVDQEELARLRTDL